ncbi:hypothetical protein GCM10009804_36020 [Kribbella hippodromi]|uniref:Uncharacterized protein n=1 Tax=Kribbella hippodromi TaxID=434347 RepID=A0ABP4P948_9ACTN
MSVWVAIGLVLAVLAAAGIVWGIVALVRRQQFISSVRKRGWTFVNTPGWDSVARLGNPPFGLGFNRKPDDQVIGTTTSGRAFQVIEYKSDHWSGWVGMVQLSRRLPELWIMGGGAPTRYGVNAHVVPASAQLGAGWQIGARDTAYAQAVLTPEVCSQLTGLVSGELNLSVDSDQLVVLDPPRKDVDLLAAWLDQLAAVAARIDAAPLDQWIQPEPPDRLTFYQHPDWHWVGVDDSLLEVTPVNRGGHSHSTSDVIRGRDGDGPPFVAFTHHWQTTRTETSTDSEGRTQTRTVTENHSEPILGFQLPVRMPELQVGRKGFGRGISFESEAFNKRFAVQAQHTKFAYDVIHPRQMEYLMAAGGYTFRIEADWVWFTPSEHSQPAIAASSAFLYGFLGRIPRFVWRNLGLPDAPYAAPAVAGVTALTD